MSNDDAKKLILVLSVILFVWGFCRVVQDSQTYFWTPVTARVIQADVRCCSSKGEPESVYVKYEYDYLNVHYMSDSITLNYRDMNSAGEKLFVSTRDRNYSAGQTLTAYVSGNYSVLERGIEESAIYIFMASLFMFLFQYLIGLRKSSRK